ncbi:Malaria antigen [Plasmodium coatneyi]|uniref:Malaria antigen n=1 Tax=Plasmodium coatneyi TaxID=208452 RepID=A0A1B1E2M5_9APIC|nr:Malaria antigen [Plasmodium coatneyi]ANQ09266.1 Malaria antigen [Plasmodium coatneyi]
MKSNSQCPPQNNDNYRNNTPDNDKGVSNESTPRYALTSNNANMLPRSMDESRHNPSNGAPMSQSSRGGTTNNVMKILSKSSPLNYSLNNHTFYNQHNMLHSNNSMSKSTYGSANSQSMVNNVKMVSAMRKADDNLSHNMNDTLNKPFRPMNYSNLPSNIRGRAGENVGNLSQMPYRNVMQNNNNEAVVKNGLMSPELSNTANGDTPRSINNVNNLSRINAADFISRVNAPGQMNSIKGRNSGVMNAAASSSGKAFSNLSSMHGSMNMAPFSAAQGYPLVSGNNGGRNNMHIVSGMGEMTSLANLNRANYNMGNLKSSMGYINRGSASGGKIMSSNVSSNLSSNLSGYPGALSSHNKDNMEIMQASGNSPSNAKTIEAPQKRSYRKSNSKVNPNERNEAEVKDNNGVVSNVPVMHNHLISDMRSSPALKDQYGSLVQNGKNNPSREPYSVHNQGSNFYGNANAGGTAQGIHNVNGGMQRGPPGYYPSSKAQMSPNVGANEQNANLLSGKNFLQAVGSIPGVQNKNDWTSQYNANNVQGDKAENGRTNNVQGDPNEDTNSLMNNNAISPEKTKKRKRKEKGMEQDTPPKVTKRKSKNAQNNPEQTMITNNDANCLQDVASSLLDNPIPNCANGAEMINDPSNNKMSKRKPKTDEPKRGRKKKMESTNAGSSYPSGEQNNGASQTGEYLTEDRNGFYISSSVAQENMKSGVMNTYGNANYLNNPTSASPQSNYYNSFNKDKLAEVPNVRSNWGERENIRMMNGNQVDGAVNPYIVKGVSYNPNVSNGNTSMNEFMNEQFRENNNAQILRDAHLGNSAQGVTHSYMGVEANKQMNENLTHMVAQKGNNEMYKKEQLLRKDQVSVDAKFVWLFLNKEFSENKNKYARFLPLFNSYYPSKLNELIRQLEEYSLLSYAHVMNGALALQRIYLGGLTPSVVATGDHATSNMNASNAANTANAANAANAAACPSSGYSDGHIDNKLLNNINSNFNELIKNFSIESGPAPNAPVGGGENTGKGRRGRKSDNTAGKTKKEGAPRGRRPKKGTTTENISGAQIDSSVNVEGRVVCENDNDKVANAPTEPGTSNKNASTNDGTPQLLINEQGQMVPVDSAQAGQATNSYILNLNGSMISEKANDVMNLINSKNEYGSIYKGSENSIGKGVTNLCDTMSYHQGNFPKDENDLNKVGNTLINDVNSSGKNGKVRKYRKKKDNNNLASENKGDIATSALDSTCMESEKKKRKKKNDPPSISEHTISAPNGVSISSQNGHVNTLSDLPVEVKGRENMIETYPNGVEAACAGDNEDPSATYLLNCVVDDYNKEMSKRKRKGSSKEPNESKRKATTKDVVKKEKTDGRGKNRTKKIQEVQKEEEGQIEEYLNREMYALEYERFANANNQNRSENFNLPTRRRKQLRKRFLQQENRLYHHMRGAHLVNKNLSKHIRLSMINAIKKKYKRFNFCVNKVFRKRNINDIIALNENLNNNRDLLVLFKRGDVRNLKKLNFSFFMNKLEMQKIDMIIMKRIQMCAQNMKNSLGFTCVINNVEKIVELLKKAFKDRLQLMWPMIEFSSKYRLDQYFHLLTKNRMNSQSRFKHTRLFVHQNIAPLIAYFNQRTIDDKIVEYLRSQIRPKKRRRKNKNKDPFSEDKSFDLLKTMNTITSNNFTTESLLNLETARTKASEFAFVGYNQKRLLTQVTPYDYKNILNSEFCNKLFTMKWREQQALFINHLHFDMVPDNEETKNHFEKVYMRYMGYNEKKLADKMEDKAKPRKPKSKNDIVEGVKAEGKPKTTRKRKTNKNNEDAEKEPKIVKPRRKYERVKPRKSKNQSGNAEADQGVQGAEVAQNVGDDHNASTGVNPPNDFTVKEGTSNRKGRKPREQKAKSKSKNAQNNDLTLLKGDPNAVIQASIDFMDPNMFT